MSAISDYAAAVETAFSNINVSVETLGTGITGVTKDVADLKAIIEQINNNPGPISTEDQALLTNSLAKLDGLKSTLQSLAEAASNLDNATGEPPVPTPDAKRA